MEQYFVQFADLLLCCFCIDKSPADKLHIFRSYFMHPDVPGSRTHFETSAAVMYLEKSEVIGSGLTGPSVLLNLNLSFKPKAAGRVFRVEAFATDDDGNQQGFDEAGIIGVLRK